MKRREFLSTLNVGPSLLFGAPLVNLLSEAPILQHKKCKSTFLTLSSNDFSLLSGSLKDPSSWWHNLLLVKLSLDNTEGISLKHAHGSTYKMSFRKPVDHDQLFQFISSLKERNPARPQAALVLNSCNGTSHCDTLYLEAGRADHRKFARQQLVRKKLPPFTQIVEIDYKEFWTNWNIYPLVVVDFDIRSNSTDFKKMLSSPYSKWGLSKSRLLSKIS